jgi:acetyl-CoA carboxylase carboxyl transferase subunit alpha
MSTPIEYLPFEKDIQELEALLNRLESNDPQGETSDEVRRMRRELTNLIRKIYNNLGAWDTVTVSRHKQRPQTTDYISMIFDEFVELHGDRAIGDDRAIRTGFARIGDHRVLLIGQQKGHTLKERNECLFGCAHPEGYRKALIKMKLAAKFKLPVICLIDTPGAYPGIGAEERGQSEAIGAAIAAMAKVSVPILASIIGEGGSGGALALGVANRVLVLEFGCYSVISPEGCAAILWKDGSRADEAATQLKITAPDLLQLGVVDAVVEEPAGGAHQDHDAAATCLERALLRHLSELEALSPDELVDDRYRRFRNLGAFRA